MSTITIKPNYRLTLVSWELDYSIFERSFSGRMTERRKKIIENYCNLHSHNVEDCGCSHDCCGCFLGENMIFTYRQNQVVITHCMYYNY